MNENNKLILKNTLIIYVRMIIVTIVGLYSSRIVLQALGVSDYGLYNVVGGLIAMLNFISAAMATTTRRFVNIEMGKPNGNLNKIFNISLILHVLFALLILIIAETIGLWYINNYLNVEAGKEADAFFVFEISTIVACLGVVNVPYQSLIEANERFLQSALIDITTTFIKLGLFLYLIYYEGNSLRFYSISICVVTLISFILYHYYCHKSWPDVIKRRFYRDRDKYKEILGFNNYTALGAVATIGKNQGSTLLINSFFGTAVNGAFAIAFQVERYIYMFVNKLTLATNPQIAKNFSGGTIDRVNSLVEKNSRYSILIMTIFFYTVTPEMSFILKVWLKNAPKEATFLCTLTMIDALVKSFTEGTNGYIHASGKIKWFQLLSSSTMLLNLPVGYFFFKIGLQPYWIIISFIVTSIFYRLLSLWLMKVLLDFNMIKFVLAAYARPLIVITLLGIISFVLKNWINLSCFSGVIGICVMAILSTIFVFIIGLNKIEQKKILNHIKPYIVKF